MFGRPNLKTSSTQSWPTLTALRRILDVPAANAPGATHTALSAAAASAITAAGNATPRLAPAIRPCASSATVVGERTAGIVGSGTRPRRSAEVDQTCGSSPGQRWEIDASGEQEGELCAGVRAR